MPKQISPFGDMKAVITGEEPEVETTQDVAEETAEDVSTKEEAEPTKKVAMPKKDEQPPEEEEVKMPDEPPTKNADAKEIKAWKDAKATISTQGKELKERDNALAVLRSELNDLRSKQSSETDAVEKVDVLETENQRLKEQVALLTNDLKAVAYQATPEYKEKVTTPLEQINETVKKIAAAEDTDLDDLTAILKADPDKRRAMLNDLELGKVAFAEFYEVVRKHDQILQAAEQMKAEASKALSEKETRNAEEFNKHKQTELQEHATHAKAIWTDLNDRIGILQEFDGADDWNKAIKEARAAIAKVDLDALDAKQRAEYVVRAHASRFVEGANVTLKAQVQRLEAELKEKESLLARYKKVDPKLEGASDTGEAKAKPKSLEEGLMEAIGRRR